MAHKKPLARYRCMAPGLTLSVVARSVGGAAKHVRRAMAAAGVPIRTDHETGGWRGVSIECVGRGK